MKYSDFALIKYDADDDKVFDWKEPRFEDVVDENGNPTGEKMQIHLNAKNIILGVTDSIENYIEVDENGVVYELTTPEKATEADYLAALAELGVE